MIARHNPSAIAYRWRVYAQLLKASLAQRELAERHRLVWRRDLSEYRFADDVSGAHVSSTREGLSR